MEGLWLHTGCDCTAHQAPDACPFTLKKACWRHTQNMHVVPNGSAAVPATSCQQTQKVYNGVHFSLWISSSLSNLLSADLKMHTATDLF